MAIFNPADTAWSGSDPSRDFHRVVYAIACSSVAYAQHVLNAFATCHQPPRVGVQAGADGAVTLFIAANPLGADAALIVRQRGGREIAVAPVGCTPIADARQALTVLAPPPPKTRARS